MPAGQHIGYTRVSTADQNLDRQLVGIELDKVFAEKASGSSRGRPQLEACLDHLREGDTLHVHSIDRLARDLAHLQELVQQLTDNGVTVVFHKEALTFSGGANPMQTLQLQMMGAFAQFERALIRERQREGIAAAKAAGKKLGRPTALTQDQINEIAARKDAGDSVTAMAREFGVSVALIYKVIKEVRDHAESEPAQNRAISRN